MAPKFKVGDRVRCIRLYAWYLGSAYEYGKEYIIIAIGLDSSSGYLYRFDADHFFLENEIELVKRGKVYKQGSNL